MKNDMECEPNSMFGFPDRPFPSPVGISASPFRAKCAKSSGSGIGTATSVEATVLLSSMNFVVHRFAFLGPLLLFKFVWKFRVGPCTRRTKNEEHMTALDPRLIFLHSIK